MSNKLISSIQEPPLFPEAQGTSDVFSGRISIHTHRHQRSFPPQPCFHLICLITEEEMRWKEKLSEAIMIPFIFKKNVLSNSLESLLEMNVGVSKAGLCNPAGSACPTQPSANSFTHLPHLPGTVTCITPTNVRRSTWRKW